MRNYRLAEAAKEDLIRIAQYGDENFGFKQSDQYRDQLEKRFSVLANTPLLFPAIDHIRQGYRRSVCGVHSIYYRIEGKSVVIIRVLGRENPETAL